MKYKVFFLLLSSVIATFFLSIPKLIRVLIYGTIISFSLPTFVAMSFTLDAPKANSPAIFIF